MAVYEPRVTRYMEEMLDRLQAEFGKKAKIFSTGLGMKEKRPSGVYGTTKLPRGLMNSGLVRGLKIVDPKAEGTMYVGVQYSPAREEIVLAIYEKILKGEFGNGGIPKDIQASLDAVVDGFKTDVEHIRKVRPGRARYVDGGYPEGVNICNLNPEGVGVIAVKNGYGMPMFLHAYPGGQDTLRKRVESIEF